MRKTLLILAFFGLLSTSPVEGSNYNDGVFVLNEDWFGHNNSTINFWHVYGDNTIDYRVFQTANFGYSLGCTSQFGTVYGDKLFVVSKQAQDDGQASAVQGVRVIVADASTMQCIARIEKIAVNEQGKSIADGRAFVGVDENTGYIGTTNGIYVFDFKTMQILKRIEGTENPLITGNESNASGLGPLYRNQIGIMIRTQDYVFAIQQDKGVLVINPQNHTVIDTINGCFSTMVLAHDGNIYVGKNSNMEDNGKYQEYPYGDIGANGEKWKGNQLLRINPTTLQTKTINLNSAGINQSWYAWTGGSLVSSTKSNELYFIYINPASTAEWFTAHNIYKYDIDKNSVSQMFDTQSMLSRYVYTGSGLSISPWDNTLFVNMYLNVIDQNYWFCRYNESFDLLNEKRPSLNYWFPAMIVYPDNYSPVISTLSDMDLSGQDSVNVDLSNIVSDADNIQTGIIKSIKEISDTSMIAARIKGNTLTLKPIQEKTGRVKVTLQANSNGKLAQTDFYVNTSGLSGMKKQIMNAIRIVSKKGELTIEEIPNKSTVQIFNAIGVLLKSYNGISGRLSVSLPSNQMYVLKIGKERYKVIL